MDYATRRLHVLTAFVVTYPPVNVRMAYKQTIRAKSPIIQVRSADSIRLICFTRSETEPGSISVISNPRSRYVRS
jgi:hypothetical protein